LSETEPKLPARPETPAARVFVAILAGALFALAVMWILGVHRWLGLALFKEQFLAAMLALALPIAFIRLPLYGSEKTRVPWYDWLLAAAGFGAAGYVAARYATLVDQATYDPSTTLVYGTLLLVLIIEALRRSAGPVLAGIVVVFIAYGLLGHLVPGRLQGLSQSYDRLLASLMLDSNALLGAALFIAATVLVAFVFFGHLLFASGGGRFFTDLALALMGRYRGGSAKIAIVASSLFGSISGSAVSNVVSTGIVTIPLMRQGGYGPRSAGAIEAVASTGGQLMPPIMGASAFLMAEFLEIGYGEVVLAALVPAVLYYVALFMQADLRAAQAGIARVPEDEIPALRPTLRRGWLFLVPFAVLIVALFVYHVQPQEAALWSAVSLIVLGVVVPSRGERLSLGTLWLAVRRTGTTVLDIIMITAAAGFVIGVLNFSGLAFAMTQLLAEFGQASLMLLLGIAAAISILLGMGMPTIGVYVLLAALVAPSLTRLGVEPKAAHLFVLYFGMMSMITPPVAIAAFAAATISGSRPMSTAMEAVRFGWPAYVVPFLFVLSPSLLLLGPPWMTALAVVTAVAGVGLTSIGLIGYLFRPLGAARRALFALAGLALLVPAGAMPYGQWTDAAGFVLGAALVAAEWLGRPGRVQAGASARSR